MLNYLYPAIFGLGLMATPVMAGQSAVVSLDSAASLVRSNNPDLAAARLRIDEAQGRHKQAGRLANPELEAGMEQNAAFREGKLEFGFTQRFPVTARLRLEKIVTATEVKSAEAEIREMERQWIARAREGVVKVLAIRQRRELLKQQSTLANEFAGFLAGIAGKGEGSIVDAGQAKLEAASLAVDIHLLDAEELAILGELKPLLGIQPGTDLLVGGVLKEPVMPKASVDPQARPDYQMAGYEAEAAAASVALEQARRRDDIEGGVFAGADRSEDVPEGFDTEAIVGVRLKVPLPLWNRNEGAIDEARAKHQRMEMERAALARTIHLEAETARVSMQHWATVITNIKTTLMPLADEQAALAEQTYRNGQGEIQSVLRAREKRTALAIAGLEALREFNLARVRHDAATGK